MTSRATAHPDSAGDDPGDPDQSWFPTIVESLFRDFEARHPLTKILAVAQQCREDLRGSPPAALPELIERLARERLRQLPPAPAEAS